MKSTLLKHRKRTLVLLIAGAVGGCGGGGDGPTSLAAPSPVSSFLSQVAVEPIGASCAAGGVRISGGVDADGNGVLSGAEISSTQFVCNGTAGAAGAVGADGLQFMLTTIAEPAGANCASGGQRIDAGTDTNRSRSLDAGEATSRTYVCNGATGPNGAAGATGIAGSAGTNALVQIAAEAPGVQCASGGSKISSGPDTNGNGVLEPSEFSFSSYVCDGVAGPAGPIGPAGAGLQWVDVTGTSAQASSNVGYLANNDSFVSIVLPLSPQVGDLVSVSGAGLGGWGIQQNAGQRIVTAGLASTSIGAAWTPRDASRTWLDVRSSSDGAKLIASDYGGRLYTSTDGGATWTPRESNRNWHGLGSSADGTKLVAAASGGYLYTSTDSGATWTPRDSVRNWFRADSSADGTRLIATTNGDQIYTSRDSGVTWTPSGPTALWWSVASSADGSRLVAGAFYGPVYVSTDAGATWAPHLANAPWTALAMSADGMRIYAADQGASIHVSTDGGNTWNSLNISGGWNGLFTSADGQRVVASEYGGRLHTSTDGGATWTSRESNRSWNGIAGSADGTKLVAAAESDFIYTSIASTSIGTAGMLSGGQFDAAALQYLGAGNFTLLSHTGRLNVK